MFPWVIEPLTDVLNDDVFRVLENVESGSSCLLSPIDDVGDCLIGEVPIRWDLSNFQMTIVNLAKWKKNGWKKDKRWYYTQSIDL